ncbi:chemotaxis protein CheD [Oikeobacillus pervagus]|uniref:Probable chemoreceptor glutamine deamidase CheD n=1 Tax=Oikeobacillus pervagus TaxID=1325931 RepID=A0AAJ1WIC9_9BACI|nr:chemotaxis protein CheD [Oikeobacillus pervagus]MDQ0214278.1 chemotaxis protein CheD [Oikeobacillus pervagus]
MNSSQTVVKVGIADLNIVRSPNTIRTSGLGSCVGVVIYDERIRLAGLAHVMLPDSNLAKGKEINKAKFADTAIPELVERMKREGAGAFRLKAKMAGGAQMFHFNSQNDLMRIGPRNVDAVKQQLKAFNIQLLSEDVGGNRGRTIEFDPQTTMLEIRTVNKGVHSI